MQNSSSTNPDFQALYNPHPTALLFMGVTFFTIMPREYKASQDHPKDIFLCLSKKQWTIREQGLSICPFLIGCYCVFSPNIYDWYDCPPKQGHQGKLPILLYACLRTDGSWNLFPDYRNLLLPCERPDMEQETILLNSEFNSSLWVYNWGEALTFMLKLLPSRDSLTDLISGPPPKTKLLHKR